MMQHQQQYQHEQQQSYGDEAAFVLDALAGTDTSLQLASDTWSDSSWSEESSNLSEEATSAWWPAPTSASLADFDDAAGLAQAWQQQQHKMMAPALPMTGMVVAPPAPQKLGTLVPLDFGAPRTLTDLASFVSEGPGATQHQQRPVSRKRSRPVVKTEPVAPAAPASPELTTAAEVPSPPVAPASASASATASTPETKPDPEQVARDLKRQRKKYKRGTAAVQGPSFVVQHCKTSGRSRVLTSKYRGVCWYKRTQRWVVQVKAHGKRLHLGYFRDEEEAHRVYEDALLRLGKSA